MAGLSRTDLLTPLFIADIFTQCEECIAKAYIVTEINSWFSSAEEILTDTLRHHETGRVVVTIGRVVAVEVEQPVVATAATVVTNVEPVDGRTTKKEQNEDAEAVHPFSAFYVPLNFTISFI